MRGGRNGGGKCCFGAGDGGKDFGGAVVFVPQISCKPLPVFDVGSGLDEVVLRAYPGGGGEVFFGGGVVFTAYFRQAEVGFGFSLFGGDAELLPDFFCFAQHGKGNVKYAADTVYLCQRHIAFGFFPGETVFLIQPKRLRTVGRCTVHISLVEFAERGEQQEVRLERRGDGQRKTEERGSGKGHAKEYGGGGWQADLFDDMLKFGAAV